MLRISILFLLCLASIIPKYVQIKEKPITISPLIGDTLTLEERNHYKILLQIEESQSATFCLNPDSTLSANVSCIKDDVIKDTVISNYRNLESLRYHIHTIDQREIIDEELENIATRQEVTNTSKKEIGSGKEIIIFNKKGDKISGELLSVRENSLLIFNSSNCENVFKRWECINKVIAEDIDKIIIEGNSNVILGMGVGIL